jgi:glutamyl-tRNA reductase
MIKSNFSPNCASGIPATKKRWSIILESFSSILSDAKTRGKYSLSKEHQKALLVMAKEKNFEGVFVLSTCNRTNVINQ